MKNLGQIIVASLIGSLIVLAFVSQPPEGGGNLNVNRHTPVMRDGCRDIAPAGPIGFHVVDESRCEK